MASDGNDVFGSIQQDIQYEGCVNEARAYLDTGEYNKAIAAAERARDFLRSGASSAEIDALVNSARTAMARAEQDRKELAEREEAERKRIAEQERLARQQEEAKQRQAAQEEQKRKNQEVEETRKVKRGLYKCSWIAFILFTAYLAYRVFIVQATDINFGLATAIYLVIIGIWSFLGGMIGYGIAAPLIPALIVFGGLYASTAGAYIIEYYYHLGVADAYGLYMINLLGFNDFFVIKFIGLNLVLCAIVVLVFGAIGKAVKGNS